MLVSIYHMHNEFFEISPLLRENVKILPYICNIIMGIIT